MNPETAQQSRNDAMARVESNANAEWKAFMLDLVKDFAADHDEFTADQIYDQYDMMDDAPATHEPRAFGPVMMRAEKSGYIKKTNRFKPSLRSHATPRRVWASCLRAA